MSLDLELESGVCYFNNVRYPLGQYLRSGDEILRCEAGGVWIRKGEGPVQRAAARSDPPF